MSPATIASSNWLALRKKLADDGAPRKRRKISHASSESTSTPQPTEKKERVPTEEPEENAVKDGNSLTNLRDMVHGKMVLSETQKSPGKYLALDCEMVGVGIEGLESSLARVSLVNYYGHIILDDFVRQREHVVDYRTQFSGIREKDMKHAKPFEQVQKRVAELLEDRILVGHAVHNDMKALLLSHPWPQTRDTQVYAGKFKLVKTKRAALRNLVKQELDLTIQAGEHSSVTDARATMAIYRLHKKEWEKGAPNPGSSATKKRKKPEEADEHSGGGRKGVSSGMSVVVTRKGEQRTVLKGTSAGGREKSQWWKEVGNSSKSKGRTSI